MRHPAWHHLACACALLSLTLPPLGAAGPPAENRLPAEARALLDRYCASCHGGAGRARGGFGYLFDRDRLLARGQVVPGHPADSPLFQRVSAGEMPPPGRKLRPTPADLDLLQRWIASGALLPTASEAPGPATEAEALRLIEADLKALPERARRFARYLTLGHLPASERDAHRQALAKLVNSLSWHPRLSLPEPIDPGRTLYRIDLRHYRWNARLWDRVALKYPYRAVEGGELTRLTGAEQPHLRGDWFIATASRPPFYHDFLQLPLTDRGLERVLQVDVRADLEDDDVVRSGFNGSGVARNNRVIERHTGAHGAYWRSYDFNEGTGRQNLFERPLGPTPGAQGFQHAGGEIIFHLPNGLLGFLLVNAHGQRVDKAPGEIVSDPKRPDRLVENGVSCLGCHNAGLIPKDDQVRAHVLGNPRLFSREAREQVLAWYPPARRFRALLDADNKRFLAAMGQLAIRPGEPEPVSTAVLRYEGVLDLQNAASEAGIKPDELLRRLQSDRDLARALGPLAARGTVQRNVFEEVYPRLVQVRSTTPVNAEFSVRLRASIRALAVSPDGRIGCAGCDDRTAVLFETASGKILHRLEGHGDEVEAIAFAPDGKQLLSAGRDRVVRLWDVVSGRLLRRLVGHTEPVKVVCFAPGGSHAFSAGADRTIRVWDVGTGKEVDAYTGHTGTISALAVSPNGKLLLSGGADRVVRAWDLPPGRARGAWAGHTGSVLALAFAPDGKKVVSSGSDRTVRLWKAGREVARRGELERPAAALAFTGPERVLLGTGRTEGEDPAVRIWDASKEKDEAVRLPGRELIQVLAFAPDGKGVLVAEGQTVRSARLP